MTPEHKDQCFNSMQERMRYLAQVAKTNVMGNALTRGADRIDELEGYQEAMEDTCNRLQQESIELNAVITLYDALCIRAIPSHSGRLIEELQEIRAALNKGKDQ